MKPAVKEEAPNQEPKSPENLTEKMVYQGLGDFSNEFELSKEKLEISYPEGKNAKDVFEEISSLIKEGKKEGAKTGETPENSQTPAEKIAKIKESKIQDYRVEAFANCVLKVFESEEKDQDSKNKVLEKLTNAFSFLGDEETNKEAKQNKEIERFIGALNTINTDQEIEVGLKQALVGSFRDAFMKKKEPESNKENSVESSNSSPETTDSQDEEKAKTKDKTKDNPEKHFLDNYNVNYQSAGAAAAKLSIAVALCFVAPPIGFLLSAGFCAATPSWGQNAITKKKDHEIGNGFLDKEATEQKEKEQEPEAIKKALDETIKKVVKGKESAAASEIQPPAANPAIIENTNEPAALAATGAATTIENPAVETTGNQPQANINPIIESSPTTQTPAEAIDLKGIDLTFVNDDSGKKNGTRPAETLTEASSGTTHIESNKANNGVFRELLRGLSDVKSRLTSFLNKDKTLGTEGVQEMIQNPLLNNTNKNSDDLGIRLGDVEIFVQGNESDPEKIEDGVLNNATNNSTKEEGQSNLSSILPKSLVESFSKIITKPDRSSNYSAPEQAPTTPILPETSAQNNQKKRGGEGRE